jgi:dTDP-4-amino-4,6-dideoxygalactose transaminase
MKLNKAVTGVSRNTLVEALHAEGVPGIMPGYQNLHTLRLFREQLTYRKNPLPYSLLSKSRALELRTQTLPIAEELHEESFVGITWCAYELPDMDIDLIIQAFHKVWENLDFLRD